MSDIRPGGRRYAIALAAFALLAAACGDDPVVPPNEDPGYEWQLPAGFPTPRVPEDNPMSEAKVDLGRHLFYDVRLSGNESMSCASCHQQARAFTDGRAFAVGSTGETLPRSSMGLTNIGYQPVLTWADITKTTLTAQMHVPLFATSPVELGLGGMEDVLLGRLEADATYPSLFAAAYPDDADPITIDNMTAAIASFERTLISGNSPADRYREGDASALSASAKVGRDLFFSPEVGCSKCHAGHGTVLEVLFTSNFDYEGLDFPHVQFDNTGLYNLTVRDSAGWYPEPNTGLHSITGRLADMGKFKVPSLRNIEVTGPYMHDGSIATLEEVLAHYAAGGRTIEDGPNAGVGSENPYKSRLVTGFSLTQQQLDGLRDYLLSLTDQDFLTDPRFSNPWSPGTPARPTP